MEGVWKVLAKAQGKVTIRGFNRFRRVRSSGSGVLFCSIELHIYYGCFDWCYDTLNSSQPRQQKADRMNKPFQSSREGSVFIQGAGFSKISSFTVLLPLRVTSACIFSSAGLLHHRWSSPLLLPGRVRVDVFGGRAAVPHAGRGVWERVFTQEVLLHVWVPHPSRGGGHLSGHWLQKLRHSAGVSVGSLQRLFFPG